MEAEKEGRTNVRPIIPVQVNLTESYSPHLNRAALKKYHNSIKRYMINTLAARAHPRGARSLLDLACGRGGDIDKWIDARIPDVHGIDISEEEVRMASSRFEKKRGKNRRLDPDYTFEASDLLGEAPMKWNREFDLVTCMFAGHYFLQTEKMLDAFLGNVSAALRDGGFYFGTIASGRAVLELLRKRDMCVRSHLCGHLVSLQLSQPRFAHICTAARGHAPFY